MPEPSPSARSAAVALPATLAIAAFSLYSLQPPAPLPDTAPAGEFSSARALRHVRQIAQAPHPTGSPANTAAREYILSAFRQLGLDPQVQETVGVRRSGRYAAAAIVRNIAARLPGLHGPRAVLLAGHYDSVPSGPGAGDDAHSAGVLLETLRALRAGPPLRNDVIFLLTDGEELDLLGASAFVQENSWARDAAVVLNFEARGVGGPAHMFETSEGNGWLIRQFAQAAPYPRADSVSYEIYRRMPNDTDLTVFKQHGYSGLNFAFIGDVFFYHTPFDDLAHLDAASVQQQGAYALSLARQFGNADMARTKAPDVVYFTAPFRKLVVYPQAWVWPLAVLTLLLLAALLYRGLRRGVLTAPGILCGVLAFLLSAMAAPAVTAGLWWTLLRLHPFASLTSIQPYNWRWYEAAFLALTLALTSAVYGWFHRRLSLAKLAAGVLLVWAAAAAVSCALAPTASFLFTWPLLAALPAYGAVLSESRRPLLWMCLSGAVAAWLVVPYIDLLFVSLTVSLGWLSMAVLVLWLGLILPLWLFAAGRSLSLAALGVCLAALAGALLTGGFTSEHPKPTTVFYALDAASGQALWASDALEPDPWTAQFIPDVHRRASLPGFFPSATALAQSPAPALPLAAPEVDIVDDQLAGDVRTLTLWIRSPRQAQGLLLLASPPLPVRGFAVNGRPFDPDRPGAPFRLGYFAFRGVPPDGILCRFEVAAQTALKFRVIDCSDGVPGTHRPRPPGVMRSIVFWPFNETTLVARDFTLPAR